MKKITLILIMFICSLTTDAQWVQTGPYGGQITCIAISGINIFAGTAYGGLFLSTDNGTSWTVENNGLEQTSISAIAINGSNIVVSSGNGTYISTDNGNNWTLSHDGSFTSLTFCGSNIFAGTQIDGIFRSTDNGNSWTAVDSGLTASESYIWALTASDSTVYAAISSSYNNVNGVYLSTNNGDSWKNTGALPNAYLSSIIVSGTNIFVGTGYYGVYLSTNNGSSWSAVNNGLTSTDVLALATDGTNIFAGTAGGIFLSTNNGNSWASVNNGITGSGIDALAISGTSVFAGSNTDGMFLSTNNGSSWTPVNNGLSAVPIEATAVIGSNIIMGSDVGLYLSSDNGSSWTKTSEDISNTAISSLAVSGTNVFASSYYNGVFLSTDNGNSWTAVNNGLSDTEVAAVTASNPFVFAGTFSYYNQIFFSPDNGGSWQQVGNIPNSPIQCLAVSGTTLLAGVSYGIYLSSDNGNTWTQVATFNSVRSLTVYGSKVIAGTYDGEFISGDNGNTWNAINGSPQPDIQSLAFKGQTVYAGTNGSGGFLSNDGGNTWKALNDGGLSNQQVFGLAISGSTVFAGTIGASAFQRQLPDTTVNPQCAASFTISPDSTQFHYYIATNNSYGVLPLKYFWVWGDSLTDTIPYPSHTYADTGFYDICLSITDSTGCTSTYCDDYFHALRTTNTMVHVNVVPPNLLGVKKLNFQTLEVTIYPNPAINQLTIHTAGQSFNRATVSIMNVLGQNASPPAPLQGRGGDAVIDISALPAGMYFLQLKTESGSVVKKFVKE